MIYDAPKLNKTDAEIIDQINQIRTELRPYVRLRRRWYGTLYRALFARAVQGSNSIEGYHASVEEAAAVLEDDAPVDLAEDTRLAIAGYRDAMTYALQLAAGVSPPLQATNITPTPSTMPLDAIALLDLGTLRSMHFMMLKHDFFHNPGQLRPGAIWVADSDGESVYDAPERAEVESLLKEMCEQANTLMSDATVPDMVAAAMAHLNLVLIHPFSDGNGRMARCIQTFLLATAASASGDPLSHEFLSIEEYLGRNTLQYYEVLTQVAAGKWSPERSTRPWIEFCLIAHLRQAQTVLQRINESTALWDVCSQLAESRDLPERVIDTLCDTARGWTMRRSLYMIRTQTSGGEPISDGMASRDLQAMVRAGLLVAIGDKRGRSYRRSPELADFWNQIRSMRQTRDNTNPYDS